MGCGELANEHLKTIVPVVPNNPGNGLPLQNNVFILANYAWIYYATGNKTLDAGTPMQVEWLTSSYIRLRLRDPEATNAR